MQIFQIIERHVIGTEVGGIRQHGRSRIALPEFDQRIRLDCTQLFGQTADLLQAFPPARNREGRMDKIHKIDFQSVQMIFPENLQNAGYHHFPDQGARGIGRGGTVIAFQQDGIRLLELCVEPGTPASEERRKPEQIIEPHIPDPFDMIGETGQFPFGKDPVAVFGKPFGDRGTVQPL